jgi:hypothetical protein
MRPRERGAFILLLHDGTMFFLLRGPEGDDGADDRYDATGRTDDKFIDAEEMGWDAYFGTLFERLDGKMLNEHKSKYQGMSTSNSTWQRLIYRIQGRGRRSD